ncbi:MAG: hypothetical protein J5982_04385 [Bacilli bacterium]|nr:hypothetical protein [Bacilli bacterium]
MKNILAVTFGVIISVIIGSLFMKVSNNPSDSSTLVNYENNIKAFQVAAYTSTQAAEEEAKNKNGIVIKDDDYYCVYIAILRDSSNVNRMIKYLNDTQTYYYVKNIDLSSDIQDNLTKYEELMKNTNSDVAFIKLNNQILKMVGEFNED